MRTDDFDYDLPAEAIARYPADRREGSRLLRLDRRTGAVSHHQFHELPTLLRRGDVVVTNDSRVLAARLQTRKVETGGRVEVLLVEPSATQLAWRAMVKPSRRLRPGMKLAIEGAPEVQLNIREVEGDGFVVVDLPAPAEALTEAHGALPLPPYIDRDAEDIDRERYQTVFARTEIARSVAAPTAGLHFSQPVLQSLAEGGVKHARITLDVGPGTFLPVRTDDLGAHRMHSEAFSVSEAAVAAVSGADRVVAVGTTVVRTLESLETLAPGAGRTDLFIRPGFNFRRVDALITNFHLPRSTLLMLVCAFGGRDQVLSAYESAIRHGYRFYSYGDAMLIE